MKCYKTLTKVKLMLQFTVWMDEWMGFGEIMLLVHIYFQYIFFLYTYADL